MTFRQWLRYQEKHDTPVGRFAKDVARPWPRTRYWFPPVPTPTRSGWKDVCNYLRLYMYKNHILCRDPLAACEAAWNEWASRFVAVPGGRASPFSPDPAGTPGIPRVLPLEQ